MLTAKTLNELKEEIEAINIEVARLTKFRAALVAVLERELPDAIRAVTSPPARKRRKRTKAEREETSRRMKERWAERKARTKLPPDSPEKALTMAIGTVQKPAAVSDGHADAPPSFTERRRDLREHHYAD